MVRGAEHDTCARVGRNASSMAPLTRRAMPARAASRRIQRWPVSRSIRHSHHATMMVAAEHIIQANKEGGPFSGPPRG